MQRSKIQNEKRGMPLAVAKGLGISVLSGILLVAILCFIALQFDDPEKISIIFAHVALAVVAFIAGYLTSKMHGENGALCGLAAGLSLVVLMLLLCFAFSLAISPITYTASAVCSVALSALGGKSAEKSSGKRKRKRKRK